MTRSIYTTGGTVQAGGGIYLSRKADDELLQLCREGQFAYVLTSRQMGKSSLMVQTAARLEDEDITSVIIDLTKIGTNVTPEQWYLGLITEIDESLMLDTDIFDWWEEHNHLGVTQRLTRFFEEVLLNEVEGRIVLFVDEIDTTLSLGFTDDFFIAIRYFYTARAQKEQLGRLSVVLIGVASPGDLISDPQRTPFNVGRRVNLTDFSWDEAQGFATGLAGEGEKGKGEGEKGREILHWVMQWTGGHPYLTQRMCQGVVESERTEWSAAAIEQLVEDLFLRAGVRNDSNLLFVRDMLTQRTPDENRSVYEVLTTYQEIWQERELVRDEEQSLIKSHLRLAGVVRRDEVKGSLHVSNRIYRGVFDEGWVKEHLPVNWVKRLRRAQNTIGALTAVTVVALIFGSWAILAQLEASKQTRIAKNQTLQAQINSSKAFVLAEKPIEALVDAVTAGTYAKSTNDLSLQATAIAALQQAMYGFKAFTLQKNYGFLEYQRLREGAWSLAFSPDGEILASGSDDGTVKIWSKSGAKLSAFEGHSDRVLSVAFSPDGEILASGSDDSTVRLWSTKGVELAELTGHQGWIWDVAFSPDGKTLASGDFEGTVKLWDRDGSEFKTFVGHSSSVRSLAFSPDSEILASGSDDGIKLWSINGDELATFSNPEIRGVLDVTFSPNGEILASGNDNGTIVLLNTNGDKITTLKGHRSLVWSVAFSPDGQILVSGSDDGTVKLWNSANGDELATFEGHRDTVRSVTFDPYGKTLASTSDDGTVKLWSKDRPAITILKGHRNIVTSVSFAPTSELLASGSNDGTIKLWEKDGSELATLKGHQSSVRSVAFHPDGKTLASGDDDGIVKLWSKSGEELTSLESHRGKITGVIFSFDGKILASGSHDSTVKLWNRKGKELISLRGHHDRIKSIAFSPDGKTLASSSYDLTIKLWHQDGTNLATLEGHRRLVTSLAFSPDGKILASGSYDGTIKLWRKDGMELATLEGHRGWVTSVTFSPDGKTIVSGGADGTVKLWSQEGSELATLQAHSNVVMSVAFTPDGTTIASGSFDGTVKLWEGNLDTLMIWSCNWLEGYLLHNQQGQILFNENGICQDYL